MSIIRSDKETWDRVARCVRERRDQLEFSQEEAAARTGDLVSTAAWRVFEASGRLGYRHTTIVGIARALRWTDESIIQMLEGGEPTEQAASQQLVVTSIEGIQQVLEVMVEGMGRMQERVATLERQVATLIPGGAADPVVGSGTLLDAASRFLAGQEQHRSAADTGHDEEETEGASPKGNAPLEG